MFFSFMQQIKQGPENNFSSFSEAQAGAAEVLLEKLFPGNIFHRGKFALYPAAGSLYQARQAVQV
jgi:hypothetical protein